MPEANIQPNVLPAKKASSKLPIIIIALLLVVIVAGGGIFAYVYTNNQNNEKKVEETKQEEKKVEVEKEKADSEFSSEEAQEFRDQVTSILKEIQEEIIVEGDVESLAEDATDEEAISFLQDLKVKINNVSKQIDTQSSKLTELSVNKEAKKVIEGAQKFIGIIATFYMDYDKLIEQYIDGEIETEEVSVMIAEINSDYYKNIDSGAIAFRKTTDAFIKKYNLEPNQNLIEVENQDTSEMTQDYSDFSQEDLDKWLKELENSGY